jgi:hypothetical protein
MNYYESSDLVIFPRREDKRKLRHPVLHFPLGETRVGKCRTEIYRLEVTANRRDI